MSPGPGVPSQKQHVRHLAQARGQHLLAGDDILHQRTGARGANQFGVEGKRERGGSSSDGVAGVGVGVGGRAGSGRAGPEGMAEVGGANHAGNVGRRSGAGSAHQRHKVCRGRRVREHRRPVPEVELHLTLVVAGVREGGEELLRGGSVCVELEGDAVGRSKVAVDGDQHLLRHQVARHPDH
eukprot:359932-Rhodomonas_salina.3